MLEAPSETALREAPHLLAHGIQSFRVVQLICCMCLARAARPKHAKKTALSPRQCWKTLEDVWKTSFSPIVGLEDVDSSN